MSKPPVSSRLDIAPSSLSAHSLPLQRSLLFSLFCLLIAQGGCDESSGRRAGGGAEGGAEGGVGGSQMNAGGEGGRAGDQAGAQAGERAGEQAGERAGERAGEQAGLLAGGQPADPREPRPAECGAPSTLSVGGDGGALRVEEGAHRDLTLTLPPGSVRRATRAGRGVEEEPLGPLERVTLAARCLEEEALTAEGWALLSPPVALYAERDLPSPDEATRLSDAARLTLVYSAADAPQALTADHIQLLWRPIYADARSGETPAPRGAARALPLWDPTFDGVRGEVSTRVDQLGVYALAYRPERLSPRPRRFSYRGLMGVSMGGGAAAVLAARHPGRFDVVGALGGAADWAYVADYSRRRLLGGFCAEGEGAGLGALCERDDLVDPFERPSSFERLHYSSNGGDFDRDQYIKIFKDLSLLFGNPTSYNPLSPYLPAGLSREELTRAPRERCAPECRGEACPPVTWTRLEGFYDDEFNPRGERPVIPFCDGEDGAPKGVFDGAVEHTRPLDVLLAVDLNDNGRRDAGEPVIRDFSEPFEDVGCDGLASAAEEGYDPLLNPDPAGDDFHWRLNPLGSEGDTLFEGAEGSVGVDGLASLEDSPQRARLYEGLGRLACPEGSPGEPYRDVGLDGVPMTPQVAAGGYDWGEGDGRFNYNPNLLRLLEHTAALQRYGDARDPAREPRFWVDGGLRDIFNFGLSGMHFVGRLQGQSLSGRVAPTRYYESFQASGAADPFFPHPSRVSALDDAGWHVMLRYGDPAATPERIAAGDGEHVGTDTQAISRFLSFLQWASRAWPPVAQVPGSAGEIVQPIADFVLSEAVGGPYKFTVVPPPGYNAPENAAVRYPVMYMLHGYGQRYPDMAALNAAFVPFMVSGALQKMIFVYPDGSCGARWVRGEGPECSDGVDNDLDGAIDLEDEGCVSPLDDEADCVEGSFYSAHASWEDGRPGGRDYEEAILEMMEYVEGHYRTLAPSELEAVAP